MRLAQVIKHFVQFAEGHLALDIGRPLLNNLTEYSREVARAL
jgi:hypothetical protein